MNKLTTAHPVVFMYSGQGSHYYQMAKSLYEGNLVFRHTLLELDKFASSLLDDSVVEVMYDRSKSNTDAFELTRFSHPAIFMVEYALTQTLASIGIRPDFVLGTSMGAFAAAAIAQCCDIETALQAVIKQAKYLERYCKRGKMLAVIDRPETYHDIAELNRHTHLASVNFEEHFVISADLAGMEVAESALSESYVYQQLPVSVAFHSPWLAPAKEAYICYLNNLAFRTVLSIPIICCASSQLLSHLPQNYFWDVIEKPIYFQKTFRFLETTGAFHYIDVGPSGTLATFANYNLRPGSEASVHSIVTPYGQEQQKLESLRRELAVASVEGSE